MSVQKISFEISDISPENGHLSLSPYIEVDMSDGPTPAVHALLSLLAIAIDTETFAGMMEWAKRQNYNGIYEEVTGLSSKMATFEPEEPELSDLQYNGEEITIGDYVDSVIKKAQKGDDHNE